MRQHPTGQVIAEAMNHITILAWTGGKGKTMDIKMLDARQRIAAAEIPGVKAGVHIYLHQVPEEGKMEFKEVLAKNDFKVD